MQKVWMGSGGTGKRGSAMFSNTTCCNSVALTPVSKYVRRIMKRSRKCDWGFNSQHADILSANLLDHKSPMMPTGVDIRLGKGLQNDWLQAENWLRDEIGKLGHKLLVYFNTNDLSFLPRSKRQSGLGLDVAKLDFKTFLNPLDGICGLTALLDRPIWPGLEIVWYYALNPQLLINMDGATIPYTLVPGLVVYETGMPSFYHDGQFVYVMPNWHDINSRFKYVSMVAYN